MLVGVASFMGEFVRKEHRMASNLPTEAAPTRRAMLGRAARFAAALAAANAASFAIAPRVAQSQKLEPERPDMITAETENAIKRGLKYLAQTQSRDGSWRTGGWGGGYPTAMTSLAALALMSGGNTPVEGEYSRNVRLAIDNLIATANANKSTGVIANLAEEQSCMHGHGFAMLALGEAYGMEQDKSRQNTIRAVLERAIKLTGGSQSAAGGWLYSPNSGGDEGSVTVTQIQGLRSCRNGGIKVPKSIIDRACNYIKLSQQPDGGIAYRVGQGGTQPPITAAAVAVMYSAGQYENDVAHKCLDYCVKTVKSNPGMFDQGHKYYAMLYLAQAMYLSSEDNWKMYFPRVRDDLLRTQSEAGAWHGDGVGDTYGTSIALLTLQLPYANLPIFQR
jgi:hypothetical protein